MTTCDITGTYLGPEAISGRVIFAPAVTGVFTSEGIQVQRRYIAEVSSDGSISISIPATDSGNPTGWTYIVTEDFRGGRIYSINAPTGAFDIQDLAPVPSSIGEAVVTGPAGPAGPAGNQIPPFHQIAAASTWTVVHNLGTFPGVTLFADDDPTHPTFTEVDYPDLNTLTVVWPSPTSGWVYFG